ncbi:MAG: RNA-directed DNA polymerase, RNA-directed DNA polymerase [Candidatus Peregrinibacteria bacterium GW2011_GWC2_33_13]|nr:MAG: RNA-directed DNA polymerase, RNA-directed DNA polymerase [Candidatus Peregrinibacteria bacterium GW2011_GWC2_33_13]
MKKNEHKPKHNLFFSDEIILEKISSLQNNVFAEKKDMAALLKSNIIAIGIKLYKHNHLLYKSISITKRDGTTRTIREPNAYLKQLQRNLVHILNLIYKGKFCSHGFEKGKSIVTNAKFHTNKKYIFKIDLKDFFPSITFARVYGVFCSPPFNFNKDISILLAHLCIYQETLSSDSEGELPQGAPTSPIISNLICRSLDNDLFKLSKKYKCNYTRYADDITFSTNLSVFPKELYDNSQIGTELNKIIIKHQFQINESKVRLVSNKRRQIVTGIVVNKKTNTKQSYIKNIRTMLHNWEKAKYKYVHILLDSKVTLEKKIQLVKLSKIPIIKPCSEEVQVENFKKFFDEENKKNNIHNIIKLAIELGLQEAEAEMYEKLYKDIEKKPSFQRVLLGKMGHLKNVRGEDDNVYIKLWNRYCRIVNMNKYKQYSVKDIKEDGLWFLLYSQEENLNIEFKENYQKDTVLKVINSYLNSETGGVLILGVSDYPREIVGIDHEIKKHQKGEDGFKLSMQNAIIDKFKPNKSLNINYKFHKFCNKTICVIDIKHEKEPIYFSPEEKEFYVRQNGNTSKLNHSNPSETI